MIDCEVRELFSPWMLGKSHIQIPQDGPSSHIGMAEFVAYQEVLLSSPLTEGFKPSINLSPYEIW